jgi:glycosyltransferase involved in cell wall biosynthesis
MMIGNLLPLMDKDRFEVVLASLYDAPPQGLEPVLDQTEIPVYHLGKRPGFDPRILWRLDRLLAAFRPSVVHTHLGALHYALAPALWRHVPVLVHTIHNVARKEGRGFFRIPRHLAFRLGVVPVAIGQEVARTIAATYRRPDVDIVRNGIPVHAIAAASASRDAMRARVGLAPDMVLFFNVGRLCEQKDHATLIEAFAAGAARDPRARLFLAGDGELREPLQVLARTLGVEGRVRFLGMREDVPDLLAAADIFVLSSRWEGSPLAVMEAMTAGKPVVATAVGDVPELVDHLVNGFLAPPGDIERLADAMYKLAGDPELRRQMACQAARKAASHFDAGSMVRGYEGLYGKLLAAQPGAAPAGGLPNGIST